VHFPPERNYLDAHLTLFHNLPAAESTIAADIEAIATQQHTMVLQVDKIVSIGNGTAYHINNTELQHIHHQLQQKWMQWLIPQDKQKLWPHISIQNKVDADIAKALQAELNKSFKPFTIIATGFSLWEYLGGPWKHLQDFKFTG